MMATGTLPKGIEIDGVVYREFSLREQLVGDEIEILESDDAERATKSDAFFGVCIMAKRLRLTGYDGEITPAMVMGMASADYSHLLSSGKAQETERASFRDAAEAAPDAATDAPEVGVHGG